MGLGALEPFQGLGFRASLGTLLGLRKDNGKENGNYYLGFIPGIPVPRTGILSNIVSCICPKAV